MTDEYGRRGSLGNLMKLLNRILKELEQIHALLRTIAKKSPEDDEFHYVNKSSQSYANKTGTKRG